MSNLKCIHHILPQTNNNNNNAGSNNKQQNLQLRKQQLRKFTYSNNNKNYNCFLSFVQESLIYVRDPTVYSRTSYNNFFICKRNPKQAGILSKQGRIPKPHPTSKEGILSKQGRTFKPILLRPTVQIEPTVVRRIE